jgi:hypothetical protein
VRARQYKLSAHTPDDRKSALSFIVKSKEGGIFTTGGAMNSVGMQLLKELMIGLCCAAHGLLSSQKKQERSYSVVLQVMRGKYAKLPLFEGSAQNNLSE